MAEPVFRKVSVMSGRTRQRLASARYRLRQAELEGRVKIRTDQARLLAEVCVNGGAVGAAADRLGINREKAYRWMHKPAFRRIYEEYLEAIKGQVMDWGALLGRAQATLLDLLDSEDERVRKDVAIYLTNRAVGTPTNKVEATVTHQAELTGIEMQAALSLVAEHGMALLDAKRYVREHPDEVRAWAMSQMAATRSLVGQGATNVPGVVSEEGSGLLVSPGASSCVEEVECQVVGDGDQGVSSGEDSARSSLGHGPPAGTAREGE